MEEKMKVTQQIREILKENPSATVKECREKISADFCNSTFYYTKNRYAKHLANPKNPKKDIIANLIKENPNITLKECQGKVPFTFSKVYFFSIRRNIIPRIGTKIAFVKKVLQSSPESTLEEINKAWKEKNEGDISFSTYYSVQHYDNPNSSNNVTGLESIEEQLLSLIEKAKGFKETDLVSALKKAQRITSSKLVGK